MKRVAVDPGVSTGVAVHVDDFYFTTTLSPEDVIEGDLRDIIQGSDQVIMEHFTVFYAKSMGKVSAAGLRTIETVGRVHAYCETLGIPLARRHPQNRKAFMTRAKTLVKQLHPKATVHEVDAMAHLLAWEYLNPSLPLHQDIVS